MLQAMKSLVEDNKISQVLLSQLDLFILQEIAAPFMAELLNQNLCYNSLSQTQEGES